MPDTPKIKFRYNGEVYEMPWTDKKDPSQAEMQKFAQTNPKGTTPGERGKTVWDEMNISAIPQIAEGGKWLGEKAEKAIGGKTGKFANEFIGFTGDVGSGLFTPFNISLMGLMGGAQVGARKLAGRKETLDTAKKVYDTFKVKGVTSMLPELKNEVVSAAADVAKSQAFARALKAASGVFGVGALANAVNEAREGRYGSAAGNLILAAAGVHGAVRPKIEPPSTVGYEGGKPQLALPPGKIEPPKALGPGKTVGPNIELDPRAIPPKVIEEVNPATGFKLGTPPDQQARFVTNELGQTADATRKYPIELPIAGDEALWNDVKYLDPTTIRSKTKAPGGEKGFEYFTPTVGDVGEITNVPHDIAAAYGYSPTGGLGGKPEPGIGSLFRSKPLYNEGAKPTQIKFGKNPELTKPYEPSSTGPIEQAVKGQEIFKAPEISSPYPKTTVFPRTKLRNFNLNDPKYDFKSSFKGLVNNRHAARLEATFRAQDFKDLDQMFPDVASFAKAYQDNPRGNPLFVKLKNALDEDFNKSKGVFDDLWYKKNYLPQLWKEKKSDVIKTLGLNDPNSRLNKRIGTRPFFTLDSFFKTYEEGINSRTKDHPNGLTPAFSRISDLLFYHKNMVEKAGADKKFWTELSNAGLVKPKLEIPRDAGEWKVLDSNHVPTKFIGEGGDYAAPREIADVINNYLRPADEAKGSGALQMFGDVNNYLKNIYLSSGVPKTALNVHGYNILRRDWAARGAKKELATDFFRPEMKWDEMMKDPAAREAAIKSTRAGGMIQGIEEHQMSESPTGSKISKALEPYWLGRQLNKGLEFQKRTFEDPLFQGMLPMKKLRFIQDRVAELKKQGMEDSKAWSEASHQANIFYGGLNLEEEGRSRIGQNIFRGLALAPDWLESNIRYAGKAAKSMVGKEDPIYAKSIGRMASLRLPAVAAAYAIGEQPWGQNDSTSVPITTLENNREMQLPVYGTAAEALRIPEQVATGAAQGDFRSLLKLPYNRMAAVPKAGINLITNRDSMGNPLTGVGRFGQPISGWKSAANIGMNAIQPISPPYMSAVGNWATGMISPFEAALNAVESPFQFRYTPKKKTKQIQF